MAAGSGTSVYPTAAGESVFSDLGGGLVTLALGILTGSQIKQADQAIAKLYQEANFLAVQFVEFVVAELWWAAHLGTATAELAGYLDEAGDSINTLAHNQVDAWHTFLEDKYPADLRDLYDRLSGKVASIPKVNLKPLEAAIKELQTDDSKNKTWRKNTVTPKLTQWSRFWSAWTTTYLKPLETLIDWLKHPAHLASFALPAFVAGMPSQLNAKASSASTVAIERALLATWQTDPDVVLGLVYNWLLTEA